MACAIVIDVGYWWANGKKAQIAADACALAAASKLPYAYNDTECVLEGSTPTAGNPDYALSNLPLEGKANEPRHLGTLVTSPYPAEEGGDPARYVEAKVTIAVRTFFGRIIGKDYVTLTRRAVAEQQQGVNEVTIHAHDTNCGNDALVINGKDNVVEGLMESNGYFEWNGENFESGPTTAGGPNNCLIKVNGPGASFGGDPTPTRDPVPHPWPAYFVPWENPFGWLDSCDFTKQNFRFDKDDEVLPPGIYCALEDFEVSGKRVSGEITVLSPLIKINAEGTRFSPAPEAIAAGKPLLFFHIPNGTADQADDLDPPFCEYRKEMILNALGVDWTGIIFNPCDRIVINGDENSAVKALIEAQTVRINGESFNIDNLPFQGGPVQLALVE